MKLHPSIIDVIFLVLVCFMVLLNMATFHDQNDNTTREDSLPPINLSEYQDDKSKAGVTASSEVMIVSLAPSGKIYIDNEVVGLNDLAIAVEKRKAKEVSLRVDEQVYHGFVMEVMKACQESGLTRLSFAYEKK